MNKTLFASILVSMLCISVSAYADGMPNAKKQAPTPVIMPLDEAINQIENKEPPVEAVIESLQTPMIEQAEQVAEPLPAPVPEARVVEVQPNTSFFGMSMGIYNVGHNEDMVPVINAEWQPGVKILGFLQPIFGAFATPKGTMMGYGGVGIPLHLTKNIYLMPSAAVGAYKEGAGYDLGKTLAYRVGTELGYKFQDQSRLGFNAHIITNGESLNKIDRTGIVSLVYTMPITFLSGGSKPNIGPAPVPPQ